jgi:nucleotide-binding universal stress UspA family protein
MKDVLALLSPTPGDQLSAGAHYALGLARAHGALLSALIAEIEAYSPNLPPEPDNVQADNATIEQLARTAALVLSAAKLANVSCEILAAGNQVVSLRERVIDCAQVRDALIFDVYGPLQSPRKDLVDGNLFGSGRPVVLVPQSTRAFAQDRILLAWDATRSAVRAVHDALPLLIRARDVTIVSVIDDKTFSTSDSGDALCDYLARWNVDAKFSAINRESTNIGTTLLAYAQRTEADLLVMGGFAHGMERALMLGSATQDVFRTSLEIPVFLSH